MTAKNHSGLRLILALFLLVGFMMNSQAFAQTLVTLEGKVIDEQGVTLPGATVTVINSETGYKYSGIVRSGWPLHHIGYPAW